MAKHPIVGTLPRYSVNRDRSISLDSAWKAQNIGVVSIPQLAGEITFGGKFSGNVWFYKRAIPQLRAAWQAVEDAGLLSRVIFWSGSFVPRLKVGGSTPSNHTWGTAFDINHQQNGFKVRPAGIGETGCLRELVPIFESFGFLWGGDWQNTPDGMHFEVKRILSASEIAAASAKWKRSASPSPLSKVVTKSERAAPLFVLNDFALSTSQNRDGTLWAPVDDVAQALGVKGERVDGRYYAPVTETIANFGGRITARGDKLAELGRYYIYASQEKGDKP